MIFKLHWDVSEDKCYPSTVIYYMCIYYPYTVPIGLQYIWKGQVHKFNMWDLLTRRSFLLLWSSDVKCSADMWNQNHEQSHILPFGSKFIRQGIWMLLSILQPHSCFKHLRIIFSIIFLTGFMLCHLLKFCPCHMSVSNIFPWKLHWVVKIKHFHMFLGLGFLHSLEYFLLSKINLLSNIDFLSKRCFLLEK